MLKKIIICFLFILISWPLLFAEIVVLKSGRIIEGKVIEKTNSEIKLDTGTLFMVYYLDEVESIDGKKPQVYKPKINTKEEKESLALLNQGELLNKGLAYLDAQRLDEAISQFTQAIEMNPNFFEAFYNRGLAFAKRGNLEQAISDYTRAIELKPNDSDTYYNRGLAFHKKNQLSMAVSDYTKAIEINPAFAEAYSNRAFDRFLQHEYSQAWEDVHKAEGLGLKVNVNFLEELKKASGRSQ